MTTQGTFRRRRLRWADALTSGKFEQGASALRTPGDEYCCLGVACQVIGIKPLRSDRGWEFPFAAGDFEDLTGRELADWLGLEVTIPYEGFPGPIERKIQIQVYGDPDEPDADFETLGEEANWQDLSALNDNGCTFEQIAHMIRTCKMRAVWA